MALLYQGNWKMTIEDIKAIILPILTKHGVSRASLFGSFVRGDESSESDIDILVEINTRMSLLDFSGLKIELEEALGRKVDLVEYCTIKPLIKGKILSEQVPIL
jgi:predicted nucleotidyltransferase